MSAEIFTVGKFFGAESAWTAWVSDDVRKKIDDGIGSTATDFVHSPETAWNAIP